MDNDSNNIFQAALYKILNEVTKINHQIITREIKSFLEIKKRYITLKNSIDKSIPSSLHVIIESKNIQCIRELQVKIEKSFAISLQFFKTYCWGEFSELNSKVFPELYSMMIDRHGDILRSYDDFGGTLAAMDFHGYTQFSKDIKYNKTPLLEFGNILPQKIKQICNKCKSIVYEMEGDTVIIIGPENPIYILNAVLCIIELCRQRQFKPGSDPKKFHNINIKNPMIKPFEINAAITTGGRAFINKNGHVIGSLISEASRILKIINTKKPDKSGIILSEKVYRKLNKYKEAESDCHISIFDFKASDPFLVDVKGTRLNIREVYLEQKIYIDDTKEYAKKLSEEIKKKSPSKWHNILSYYINLVLATTNYIKCYVQIGTETYNQDKIRKLLEAKFYDWISYPGPSTINDILRITSLLYNTSPEVRDVTAVYHEFIQENYNFIAKRLDEFYQSSLKKESNSSPSSKRIIENYEHEINNLRKRFPAKRIMETILSNEKINKQMKDVPYMGKK
ncbi:MAG: hypothetical protein KAT05_17595 [Spirochaetes bacterium]|nr:hypothetical protein [Spirochaetota bacterium]